MEKMNFKTGILIISDISLYPIIEEINNNAPQLTISFDYHEDIIIGVNKYISDSLSRYSFIFIHSDQKFHNKPIEWQINLLRIIDNFCLQHPKIKIIFSNSFNVAYKKKALCDSIGDQFDIISYYSQYLLNIINHDNAFIFDFVSIIQEIGSENSYNYELGMLYQMPYTKNFIRYFAFRFSDLINFLDTGEKKVIILDCDNTLWQGVVGEDGIEGIFCDKNAKGLLFYNFQSFLKSRKEDGFLLCLCSKNNENEVKDIFFNKNMPLKWDDFIVKKINWLDKSENIKNISDELNLGEESFIFIDDNPFEINSVKSLTNVKSCILFENNFYKFIQLVDLYIFRKKTILPDDKIKNQQYKINKLREREKEKFQSIDDFIKELDIRISIKVNDREDFPRLSQLTEKTNQFNFNKKPYSISELNDWIDDDNLIFSLKVTDKYGDYGTVGLILIKIEGRNVVLENYILSCRVLGKKIENNFLDEVLAYLATKEMILTEILFKESMKNIPAKQFINTNNYASIIRTTK